MIIWAPAKLNLSLNILPQKRPDGLHPVKFLNCQISLFDQIKIQPSRKNQITYQPKQLLKPKNDLLSQALRLLPQKENLKITVQKNIPIRAGLGGGSADAAALINYLNKKWQLNLSLQKRFSIGQRLGLDVVYCLLGGLCLVSGSGEKVTPLKIPLPKLHLLIITPQISKPSTAWAYQNLNLTKIGQNLPKLVKLKKAIKEKNLKSITQNLHNDFEYSIIKSFPQIDMIKKDLKKSGALNSLLCGSGLSVFGLFTTKNSAQKAFNILKNLYPTVFLTNTI